jgi:hypothetical protein
LVRHVVGVVGNCSVNVEDLPVDSDLTGGEILGHVLGTGCRREAYEGSSQFNAGEALLKKVTSCVHSCFPDTKEFR